MIKYCYLRAVVRQVAGHGRSVRVSLGIEAGVAAADKGPEVGEERPALLVVCNQVPVLLRHVLLLPANLPCQARSVLELKLRMVLEDGAPAGMLHATPHDVQVGLHRGRLVCDAPAAREPRPVGHGPAAMELPLLLLALVPQAFRPPLLLRGMLGVPRHQTLIAAEGGVIPGREVLLALLQDLPVPAAARRAELLQEEAQERLDPLAARGLILARVGEPLLAQLLRRRLDLLHKPVLPVKVLLHIASGLLGVLVQLLNHLHDVLLDDLVQERILLAVGATVLLQDGRQVVTKLRTADDLEEVRGAVLQLRQLRMQVVQARQAATPRGVQRLQGRVQLVQVDHRLPVLARLAVYRLESNVPLGVERPGGKQGTGPDVVSVEHCCQGVEPRDGGHPLLERGCVGYAT
mmetsp:Transcript_40329/g.125484  ORF Transcript_40329/g.125484 Transcript_40329/m.125484 type:complete len:405 (-) Transcript_40329:97-1311(-)